MLFRSGDNLEAGAIEFIENNESITLFSAYLKLDALKKINTKKNIKQIIVRWQVEDVSKGISDMELYHYCLSENIALYRNTRIHLKVLWNNHSDIVLGSANITNRGIGERGNFNYELNGIINDINFDDKSYLNKLVLESEYVNEDLFKKLKEIVENIKLPTLTFPELPTPPPTVDYFLINQLPMTSTPKLLFEIYSGIKMNQIEMDCASHDIELYRISKNLNKEEFLSILKERFNNHPFILKFKEAVKNSTDYQGRSERDRSMKFGTVKQWFRENTTTVPVPRSFEFNDYVVILYTWICEFDECFTYSIPGRKSQVIKYNYKFID